MPAILAAQQPPLGANAIGDSHASDREHSCCQTFEPAQIRVSLELSCKREHHMESFIGKYDVALSFAGEDRAYVEEVAQTLRTLGVSVFYDKFEEAELWGKDLKSHLHDIDVV